MAVLHAISLSAVLFGLWLLLSGHYEPFLLSLGVISVVVVLLVALRMDVVDHEGHPVHLTLKCLTYWPWLAWEIIKANIDVAYRIIRPELPISPTMVRVKASQQSEVGKVIYANSITLTPGTISVNMEGDEITVHALSREGAESLRDGEMDRRVLEVEGTEGSRP